MKKISYFSISTLLFLLLVFQLYGQNHFVGKPKNFSSLSKLGR